MKASEKVFNIKPRVLMVVPNYPFPVVGGLEKQSHELAVALQRQSVTVNVISTRMAPSSDCVDMVEGIPVYRLPYPQVAWIKNLVTPFQLLMRMIVSRHLYNVVHVHQISWFGLFAIVCARLLGKPVMTKLANIREKGIPGIIRSGLIGQVKLRILTMSDCIVAMTSESMHELAQINYPESRVLSTPNGICIGELKRGTRPTGSRNVVFTGRLVKQKGVSDLLKAWVTVQDKFSDARLHIIGDGPELQSLMQLSKKLNIGQTVRFHGHVDAAWKQLCMYDVFVLPSYMEGNSNAILEAMLSGLPVIATNVGGASMQVGNKGAPWLVKVADPDLLTNKLIEILEKPAYAHQLGKEMQNRVAQYFDINVIANCYLRAYELMLSGDCYKIHGASNPVMLSESS